MPKIENNRKLQMRGLPLPCHQYPSQNNLNKIKQSKTHHKRGQYLRPYKKPEERMFNYFVN